MVELSHFGIKCLNLGLVPNLRLIWDRSGNSGTGPIAVGTGPPPLYSYVTLNLKNPYFPYNPITDYIQGKL